MSPTEELSADDKRIRAERARSALADLGWAFDSYEAQLMTDWAESKPSRQTDREAIYHRVKSLNAIKGGLERIVAEYEGEQALAEAERQRNDENLKAEEARREYRARYPRG